MGLFGGIKKAVGGVVGAVLSPIDKLAGGQARGTAELSYQPQQGELIAELQKRMRGETPSLADISTKQNVQQGLAATLAAINSSRGASPGLKTRLGMQASEAAQNEIARQGVLARMQEQNQNIMNLANVIQGAQAAQMGREQMISAADMAAKQARAGLLGSAGMAGAMYASSPAAAAGGAGGAAAAAPAAAAVSDKKEKKNIEDTEGKARDFIEMIKPKLYEYKDEMHGEGKHLGIIAQDLEKSELGKAMVKETPEGKQVDFGKGFGAVLAAVAEINQRLNELDKKKG